MYSTFSYMHEWSNRVQGCLKEARKVPYIGKFIKLMTLVQVFSDYWWDLGSFLIVLYYWNVTMLSWIEEEEYRVLVTRWWRFLSIYFMEQWDKNLCEFNLTYRMLVKNHNLKKKTRLSWGGSQDSWDRYPYWVFPPHLWHIRVLKIFRKG